MKKKITSSALAALMIAGTTSFSAFAAMPSGTVVIGTKAFDLAYANDTKNADEITNLLVAGGTVYFKDFEGNWIDNVTNAKVLASVIPAVTYKSAAGVETKFAAADKDAVNATFGVTAIGAKKLKVTFTSAVDTTKAALTVKKGTVAVSTDKIEFATDKMSATVTTTTNLTKGDYIVTVAGLTETALTATVAVEDVKVSKINVLSQTAPMNSAPASITLSNSAVVNYAANQTAFVNYAVVNQYGERMTSQTINWTQSTGGGVLDKATDGQLTIGNTTAAGTNFIPGAKVFLTGVHVASGTVVNAEVVIGLESKVDVVTFMGVYNTVSNKVEALPAGFANEKYVLLYEAKDQYGNIMSSPAHSDLVFTSDNPLFVSSDTTAASNPAYALAADEEVDDVAYNAVKLVPGSSAIKGGTVTIKVISKVTGKTSIYTIQADALGVVKTFTMSAPSKIVAEGETVEIPFTAADQFGNAVTKYSALPTTGGSIAIQLSSGLAFKQQNDGSAKLYYTAGTNTGATDTNDVPVYLTSLISDGGSFSSLMVNVKKIARPVAITGMDAAKVTSIAANNFTKISGTDLVVQDQYGRIMSDAKVETWLGDAANRIVVTSEKPSVDKSALSVVSTLTGSTTDTGSNVIDTDADYFTLVAKTGAGLNPTEKLVFGLSIDSGASTIEASKKSITFTKVDQSAYTSFVANDLGTMYNDSNATTTAAIKFNKTLKVYGVKADGTKVLLPASDYTVTTNTSKLLVTNNVISDVATAGYDATNFLDGTTYKDVKVSVLVTVNDSNGAAASIIEKELLVSNKAPRVTAIAVDEDKVEDGKATIKSAIISNAVLNSFIYELEDQYGVVIAENPIMTITNLSKVAESGLKVELNGTKDANITGAKMGDKFTVTYKYASGVKVAVEFTVGL